MLEFRNKRTSEYRKVEEGSDEHLALLEERQPDAPQRTIWEQVGRHTREAFEQRLANDALDTTDYGDDEQPINRGEGDTRSNRESLDITPTKDVARQTPTAAERATGAGRAGEGANLDQRLRGADTATKHLEGADGDEDELDDEYDPEDDDPEAERPEHQINKGGADIDDDDDEEDEDDDSSDSSGEQDYESQDVDDLKREATKRGLDVEGTGSGGNVLKGDLVSALSADDKSKS
jgi:hypothetical protein